MTYDEALEQEAYECGIEIIENYGFKSSRIKGLYSDNIIALSDSIDNKKEKSCILAEELGHYYTTFGNILDQSNIESHKQELRARLLAYNKRIGLTGVINAYDAGCQSLFEMAEYLDVTEDFLKDALEAYRGKYGEYTTIDNYIVYFEPSLGVMKIIQ